MGVGRPPPPRRNEATRMGAVMRRVSPATVAVIGAFALTVGLAACGGGVGTSNKPAAGTFDAKGPITLATGKDTSCYLQSALDKWNSGHPNEQARLIELPESADQQRQQMIQNGQTKSDAYTILNVDVVWTAEFAANGWIEQLPEDQFPLDKILKPVTETAKYFGKLYAAPYLTDGGMLYYRKDLLEAAGISSPPKTWDEMAAACKKIQAMPQGAGIGCYAGQFEKYEGLTVNFSEAIHSAGGVVVDDQGKANVNTPAAKQGLDFLVNGFKNGVISKEAITYKEEEGRRAFQDGRLILYLPTLRASVEKAVARPRVVKYGEATTAIQEEAYAALTGAKTSDQALKDLQAKLEALIKK